MKGIVVSGDVAYVPNARDSLLVFDVTDPLVMQSVGSAPMTELYWRGMAISGDVLFVGQLASGFDIFDISDPLAPVGIGTMTLDEQPRCIAIEGAYAYVCDEDHLRVIDISNFLAPVFLGEHWVSWGNDVVVLGGVAYVADGTVGVRVYDVSDPTAPTLLTTKSTYGRAVGIEARDDLVFVADDTGVVVLAVDDPASPVTIDRIHDLGAQQLTLDGERALVLSDEGLYVLGIAGTGHLEVLGRCGMHEPLGVAPHGVHAIVAAGDQGVHVVDVSNPANPARHVIPAEYGAGDVAVRGHLALIAADWYRLRVFDVSQPVTPIELGELSLETSSVALHGDFGYAIEEFTGLSIIDLTDPAQPTHRSTIGTPGSTGYHGGGLEPGGAWDIALRDDLAFLADGPDGLQVIDVSDPDAPEIIAALDTDGDCIGIDVEGVHAYLVDSGTLGIVDISDPAIPRLVSQSYLGGSGPYGSPIDVDVEDGYAYVACGHGGLRIVDVSDPLAAQQVGRISTPSAATHVAVSGTNAYVGASVPAGGETYVIDVSDPRLPRAIGMTGAPAATVAVADSVLFVAGAGGVHILPTQCDVPVPVELSSLHAVFDDGRIMLSWYADCSTLYRLAIRRAVGPDPSPAGFRPIHSLHCSEAGQHGEWMFEDHEVLPGQLYAYVVDGIRPDGSVVSLGPLVVRAAPRSPTVAARLSAAPNPTRGATRVELDLPAPSRLSMHVYDVQGRRLRTLLESSVVPAGLTVLPWDGRNDAGAMLPSGVYFLRADSDTYRRTHRVLLIR
jgi:hypothetical protein